MKTILIKSTKGKHFKKTFQFLKTFQELKHLKKNERLDQIIQIIALM